MFSELEEVAIIWWEKRRPVSFTLEDHLKNPTVNTVGEDEKALALTVADIMAGRYLKKGVKLSEL